jgi:hypothetical protein
MVANSGNIRCPARKSAEGQSRAKQGDCDRLGVCNEHVPPSEEEMCSELYGNIETSAEMTDGFDVVHVATLRQALTDCNTKYIHWRPHANRDMVMLDPKRFSVNQDAMVRLMGWAGNMTLSNAFLQGFLGA